MYRFLIATIFVVPLTISSNWARPCALDAAIRSAEVTMQQETGDDKQQTISTKPESKMSEPWWAERHAAKKAAIAQSLNVDVLLLGDSITHSWENHQGIWDEVLTGRTNFNLGFSGDRTENILWRLQDGAVEGLNPRVVMLMIGTNNTGHRMDPPADIAAGIEAIVNDLKERWPESKILLLGIFPRGQTDDAKDRVNNIAVNDLIKSIGDDEHVHYLDIGSSFFSDNGELTNGVSGDFLHLTDEGYRIWAESVKPKLEVLLNQ